MKTCTKFLLFGCPYSRVIMSVLPFLHPASGPKYHTPCNNTERDLAT